MGVVRSVIVSIPLVGLAPLFAAPVTMPHATFVLIHAVTSTILVVLVLRNNARWFGAHLEEV
jgi:energy-converting hydrogenase Eha subunit E